MKILGTGLSGLVGSRVVECLSDQVEFGYSEVDITNRDAILEKITSSDASVVLHLAAKASVDGCEKDKELGESGEAWRVNVLGTKYIAEACSQSGKKLLYVSTDFVFDGEKPPYDENSLPNPVNWYGVTKLEGEKVIQETNGLSFIIMRIAYPYRSYFERMDFVRAIIERLKNNQQIQVVTDHTFAPTFIDNIAKAVWILLDKNQQGIFHAVGSEFVSPYQTALLITKVFSLNASLISPITRLEYFKNRAKRPFRLELKNDKILKLGVEMSTIHEGLLAIKDQLH